MEANSRWIAPGHNAIVQDGNGQYWALYHAVDATRSREKATDDLNSRRVMLSSPMEWVDGWPKIRPPLAE